MLPDPYYETNNGVLYLGDCIDIMREMESDSVQCVVTSPPYWGLRDYGTEPQSWPEIEYSPLAGLPPITIKPMKCCLGLEPTPEDYIGHVLLTLRGVRRILRPDGTLWLNMGDCYIGGGRGGLEGKGKGSMEERRYQKGQRIGQPTGRIKGLKPKDLCMMPARLALALQAGEWWLRCDIIWAKKNCMPESATDRPTKAHEYLFLLTKNAKYYYDSEAIKESSVTGDPHRPYGSAGVLDPRENPQGNGQKRKVKIPGGWDMGDGAHGTIRRDGRTEKEYAYMERGTSRNRRSVWAIATQPFPEAHFATFPEKLVIPCIKAGTSEKGNCSVCGKPWTRVVDSKLAETTRTPAPNKGNVRKGGDANKSAHMTHDGFIPNRDRINRTLGWQPSCSCNADTVKPIVLDPFGGSCTVAKVCEQYGRRWVMCELSQEYCGIGKNRIKQEAVQPRFA